MHQTKSSSAPQFQREGWKLSLGLIFIGAVAGQLFLLRGWARFTQALLVGYLLLLFFRIRSSQDLARRKLDQPHSLVHKRCAVCSKMKPPRFYHCRVCNCCHFRMDHHCNWLGTCIYAGNLKLYVQLLAVGLMFATWTLIELIACVPSLVNRNASMLLGLLGGILALLAILCIFEMYRLLKDQYESLKTNQTLVEGYKRIRGRKLTFWQSFRTIFGRNILWWVLPSESQIRVNILEPTFPENESPTVQNSHEFYKILDDPHHPEHKSLQYYNL